MQKLSNKQLVLMSFMLFSMFFGAGNLIFPAFLGRASGTETWLSMAGFIISAVGLPILGVIAVAKIGSLNSLGNRVSPMFALIFPIIIYISIGPLMAIPRTATVSFEMAVKPYISDSAQSLTIALIIYSVIFFFVALWLSLSPSKLIDRFGKLLTPTLLILLCIIFIKSIITPLSGATEATPDYSDATLVKGFLDGYLTMDLLASLVFGIVIANTVRQQGITDKRSLSLSMMIAGIGAGILLTLIYCLLGYLGASSGIEFGQTDNGASVLLQVMGQLFGSFGTVILGLIFFIACLCVAIGLIISCSEYFSENIPRLSYRQWAVVITVISAIIANLGLNAILSFSVPVLGLIYPVAVVLVILAMFDESFNSKKSIYVWSITLTALYSTISTINTSFLDAQLDAYLQYIPLHSVGVGWILPAIIGIVIGAVMPQSNTASK
ncbi:MAG: branched-chain amino acid transport system II carrier protein [Bacillus sp. (in: firmicutes)]